MTKLSKDYADELTKLDRAVEICTEKAFASEIAALAPHRKQTWRNVLTLAAMVAVPLVAAGVIVGIGGGIAWLVGSAIVRALS